MLLIGGGPAAGVGALTHELALSGQLARRLSSTLGRGVDVDVVAQPFMTLSSALDALEHSRLARYDAVLVTLGIVEAATLAPVEQWRAEAASLLVKLSEFSRDGRSAVVTTVPVIPSSFTSGGALPARWANAHGVTLSSALRELATAHPGVRLLDFPSTAGLDADELPSARVFEDWATALASPMAEVLRGAGCAGDRWEELDEERRLGALTGMDILDTPPEERFTRIAAMAQQLFGTAAAALSFVDGDRQWFKARVGFEVDETPREVAFCDTTIKEARAFVVPNTLLDPLYKSNPFVTGPEHVRFYAGYPIESDDGERVGALCLYDTRPREFTAADTVLLRDLAVLVQRELTLGSDLEEAG